MELLIHNVRRVRAELAAAGGIRRPLSLEQAELPLLSAFASGRVIARDSWRDPLTVLAVQGGGSEPQRVGAHCHEDAISFMLMHRQERFFVDPGYCCRLLQTQEQARSTAQLGTWRFLAEQPGAGSLQLGQHEAGGDVLRPAARRAYNRIVTQRGGVHVIRCEASELYGAPIRRAERTWIAVMPHVLFIVDRIEAEQAVQVESAFVVNNCDNQLQLKVAAETKLVLRRGGAGMKFFQVHASSGSEPNAGRLSRGWEYAHDRNDPQPTRPGQGAEGSAVILRYTSESFRRSHTIVYAAAMDDTDTVRHWHIIPLSQRHFYVEPPAKSGGYSLELADDDALIVHDRTAGKAHRIDLAGFHPLA
ncbi:heparinase II/III domain-containing protein [Paenibacillus cymbidii]|uniref:heparinase II/III domain-containing protein n=1 Tax=Paenibacillus cymbidii TaxID=1639034 RepID=UPI0010819804|nr:heparinase II/III family protein [Paenibacillus cymbidii]